MQKFAEKPKGKELDAMKVDTTVLGMGHSSITVYLHYVVTPGHKIHILCSDNHSAFANGDLKTCSEHHVWRSRMHK